MKSIFSYLDEKYYDRTGRSLATTSSEFWDYVFWGFLTVISVIAVIYSVVGAVVGWVEPEPAIAITMTAVFAWFLLSFVLAAEPAVPQAGSEREKTLRERQRRNN